MVNIHESQKDWFEFILDLDLLDNYFTVSSEKNGNKIHIFCSFRPFRRLF